MSDDAPFILLDVDSYGESPEAVLDFEDFAELIAREIAGQRDAGCFFATDEPYDLTTADEPSDEYEILLTPDGAVQQLEQIGGP